MNHRRSARDTAGPGRRGRGTARLAVRLACIGALVAAGSTGHAQDGARFGGRLSILPVDFATLPTMSGSGEVEAVIEDRTLTIAGAFEGLSSPATAAHLHRAPPARRGPAVFALDVTPAAAGRVEGEVELGLRFEPLSLLWAEMAVHHLLDVDITEYVVTVQPQEVAVDPHNRGRSGRHVQVGALHLDRRPQECRQRLHRDVSRVTSCTDV